MEASDSLEQTSGESDKGQFWQPRKTAEGDLLSARPSRRTPGVGHLRGQVCARSAYDERDQARPNTPVLAVLAYLRESPARQFSSSRGRSAHTRVP